jgi:hypothetical protein
VDGDHDVWIVGSHHNADQLTTDVAKVAGVTTLISIYFHWFQDDRHGLARKPSIPTQLILCVVTEFHAPSRARRQLLSPSGAGNADFEVAAVDGGGGAVALAVVGDGGG